jgi:hypothetical protein
MTTQSTPDNTWPELLAGYVLGDLSSDDMIQVQAYLERHPEAIADINELQATLGLLPLALAEVPVPPQIKTQLLAAIPTAESLPSAIPVPRRAQLKAQRRWFALAGSVAAGLVAVLGIQSYQLHQELAANRQELARLKESQESLIANASKTDRYDEARALIGQSGSHVMNIAGTGVATGAKGNVVVLPAQNRALLIVENVPPPPVGKIYHLWAVVEGRKVACIQFAPESDGRVLMQIPANRWSNAVQMVVTLEPMQTGEMPTGEMVMGGDRI